MLNDEEYRSSINNNNLISDNTELIGRPKLR